MSHGDLADSVATLRRFNRHYTQRIGVLDERFLGGDRPLGPARVLFEIGPDGATILELRRRLGLDSGYLSRLLRRLESDGLVTIEVDPADGRRRVAALTTRGTEEWHQLDRRSDDLARRLIQPLSAGQRTQLQEALRTADRLLRAATVSFDSVDPTGQQATASVSRYFAELDERFPAGFDAGDALAADAPGFTAPHGCFVVASIDGDAVACGGLQSLGNGVGEIKRMWVHDEWRGLGLGRRLLADLEARSRELDHHTVRLDTNSVLTEAIRMYETSGYRAIERYNDNPYARHWFEKPLS